VIGKFRVPCCSVAVVPFVPSLLLCAANVVSPTTVGGCVAVFAALLVAFAALIPMYLLLRPYRWPGLNVACAANTAPVLGLLALMIVELQRPMGASVDSAMAVLLDAQLSLAAATVALSVALLLLSMRMDPARCLGDVLWTAPHWAQRCIRRFLWDVQDGVAAPVLADPLLDASVELQLLAEDVMEDVDAGVSFNTPCESPTGGAPGGNREAEERAGGSASPGNDECSADDQDILMLEATGVGVSHFLPSQVASRRSDLERLYDAIAVFNPTATDYI
jgi:hypothetical protein